MNTKACLAAVVAAVLSAGCAGTSEKMQSNAGVGRVTTSASKFDGTRRVTMEPAYVAKAGGGMAEISIGFSWQETTPELVGMLVRLTSLSQYQSITAAALNIDGEIIRLEPTEIFTQHQGAYVSGLTILKSDKVFSAPMSMVEKMNAATSVMVKVESGRAEKIGDFKADSYGNVDANSKLPEFLSAVRAL